MIAIRFMECMSSQRYWLAKQAVIWTRYQLVALVGEHGEQRITFFAQPPPRFDTRIVARTHQDDLGIFMYPELGGERGARRKFLGRTIAAVVERVQRQSDDVAFEQFARL